MSGNLVSKQQALDLVTTIEGRLAEYQKALPPHLPAGLFVRVVKSAIQNNPTLLQCAPGSILTSVQRAAERGLMPDGREGALVPFRDRRHGGKLLAQWMPMYQGLLSLCERSGLVKKIEAQAVYDSDAIELEFGSTQKVRHVPNLDRTGDEKMRGVYARAMMTSGEELVEWMSKAEVDKIKGRSRAGSEGPWVTDYVEMARKTVLRRLMKRLPQSSYSQTHMDAMIRLRNTLQDEANMEAGVLDVEAEDVTETAHEPVHTPQEEPKGALDKAVSDRRRGKKEEPKKEPPPPPPEKPKPDGEVPATAQVLDDKGTVGVPCPDRDGAFMYTDFCGGECQQRQGCPTWEEVDAGKGGAK